MSRSQWVEHVLAAAAPPPPLSWLAAQPCSTVQREERCGCVPDCVCSWLLCTGYQYHNIFALLKVRTRVVCWWQAHREKAAAVAHCHHRGCDRVFHSKAVVLQSRRRCTCRCCVSVTATGPWRGVAANRLDHQVLAGFCWSHHSHCQPDICLQKRSPYSHCWDAGVLTSCLCHAVQWLLEPQGTCD